MGQSEERAVLAGEFEEHAESKRALLNRCIERRVRVRVRACKRVRME